MESWYDRLPGELLLQMEQARLRQLLPDLLGNTLLQVGGPSNLAYADASPIDYRVYCSPDEIAARYVSSVQGELTDLPFLSDSFDLVILAHALEQQRSPQMLLSESFRVLSGQGYLMIVGFNPYSLWGLSHKLYRRPNFPWDGHFHSKLRIKYYLRQLGYVIRHCSTLSFRPPCDTEQRFQRLLFLEALGQICMPGCGGVYVILAQKVVQPLTPIKEQFWQKKLPVQNNGYAEPTTRIHHE